MASRPVTTGAPARATAFIAKLLAPLPADVPQVADKGFLRALKEDAGAAWRRSLHPVIIAKARLDYVRAQRLADLTVDEDEAFAAYVIEIDRQMAVPTILKEGIAWKRRHLPVGAFHEATERRKALIARDEALLLAEGR